MITANDVEYLQLAVELGRQSPPTPSAFSVGAVIVSVAGAIIATGYTRELGDNWHAEEAAVEKARRSGATLKGATLYSSIEPCGQRLSGRTPCARRIIEAGIKRVVYCLDEPPVFVRPHGCKLLVEAGVTVERDDRFAEQVLRSNRAALRGLRRAR